MEIETFATAKSLDEAIGLLNDLQTIAERDDLTIRLGIRESQHFAMLSHSMVVTLQSMIRDAVVNELAARRAEFEAL